MMNNSVNEASQPGLWIFLYFVANLLLTLHNKWVLSRLYFNFPWTLTALHIGISGIGAYLLLTCYYKIQSTCLNRESGSKLLMFSILYTINIAISNVSLAYVSLAFHQLVRSATPAFTVVMEVLFFGKSHSRRIYFTLLPVVMGICLATFDEFSDVSFTFYGLLLTVIGVVLSCLKGIVTNILMVGPLKMHPLEVIWRMAPSSVIQCIVYGAIFGEISHLPEFFLRKPGSTTEVGLCYDAILKLYINGLLAMWLNWVSFTANKKTSALTMTVAGNIKQALSIIFAIYIFDTRITLLNSVGIVVALAGGVWYSYESYKEQDALKRRKEYNYLQSVEANA